MSKPEIPKEICKRFKNIIYDTNSSSEFKNMIYNYRDYSNAKIFYGTLLQLLIMDDWDFNTPETLLEKIKIVLEAGADVNINDDDYISDCDSTMIWHDNNKLPIHLVCFCAMNRNVKYINKQLIDILLDYGADINSLDSNGFTPILYITYFYKDIEFFKYLLEKGANIHAVNNKKLNIIHILCENYYITERNYTDYDIIKNALDICLDICLENSIDINSVFTNFDNEEVTPLGLGMLYNSYVIIELLIEKGAFITDNLIKFIKNSCKKSKKIFVPITNRIYNRIMELEQQKYIFKRAYIDNNESDKEDNEKEEDDIDNDDTDYDL